LEVNSLLSLLQSLQHHWQQSAKAYAAYMANGKQFQYAEQLRVHNTTAKDLLQGHMALLPDGLKEDAAAVVEHYTIWTAKWDALKEEINPSANTVFVFENEHRFPKAAAQNIESVYNELLKKSKGE